MTGVLRSVRRLVVPALCCASVLGARQPTGPKHVPINHPNHDGFGEKHEQRRRRVDLSGSWATGSSGEPKEQSIVVTAPCHYRPSVWVLEQNGDTVRAYTFPEHYEQGVAVKDRGLPVPAVGRFSGGKLTLRLGSSRYVLRYDSSTGHLRGRLNGKRFWAAREEIAEAGGCIPVR